MIISNENFSCQMEALFILIQVLELFTMNLARNVNIKSRSFLNIPSMHFDDATLLLFWMEERNNGPKKIVKIS